MMTLLKSFGTSSQPITMSELVTHASAEKCDDLLKVRKPSEGALHKGAPHRAQFVSRYKQYKACSARRAPSSCDCSAV